MAGGNLPKTTKNNVSKFYSNGQGSQDLSGGFLNALSTPQNKQNSFRNDVIRGVPASMVTAADVDGAGNQASTNAQHSSNKMSSGLNIRQSAQIDRKANNSSTNDNGMKNTNSQQFSNVQFNQAMIVNGSKSRPGQTTGTMGSEMQSAHGHSKSMSNAHGAQYNQQNLAKLEAGGKKLKQSFGAAADSQP